MAARRKYSVLTAEGGVRTPEGPLSPAAPERPPQRSRFCFPGWRPTSRPSLAPAALRGAQTAALTASCPECHRGSSVCPGALSWGCPELAGPAQPPRAPRAERPRKHLADGGLASDGRGQPRLPPASPSHAPPAAIRFPHRHKAPLQNIETISLLNSRLKRA